MAKLQIIAKLHRLVSNRVKVAQSLLISLIRARLRRPSYDFIGQLEQKVGSIVTRLLSNRCRSNKELCYPMTGRLTTFSVTRGERWPSRSWDLRTPRFETTSSNHRWKNQLESSASGFRKSFTLESYRVRSQCPSVSTDNRVHVAFQSYPWNLPSYFHSNHDFRNYAV